jgi:hypothetical protein
MMICALTSVFSSLQEAEPKNSFTFNDTRFKTGECADDTNFRKSESVVILFSEKSVSS